MHLLDTIGKETHQTRQHISSHQQSRWWWALVRHKALCHVVSMGTCVGLQAQKPISMMFNWMVRMLTIVDLPALKYTTICGRVALLICWMILFSCRWSCSCRIFFWPQWFQRFNVLLESQYSWWTYEMVVRENPNTSLPWRCCAPISPALTITPLSNSLKPW